MTEYKGQTAHWSFALRRVGIIKKCPDAGVRLLTIMPFR